MKWLGLTVKTSFKRRALILDYDFKNDEYIVQVDGTRDTVQRIARAEVYWDMDIPADPELAEFRKQTYNSGDALIFTGSGWDVISADDDLDDKREDSPYDSGRIVGDEVTGTMPTDAPNFVEPNGRSNPESWGGEELIQTKPLNPEFFPADGGPSRPYVRPNLDTQEAYFASTYAEASNLGRAFGEGPSLDKCTQAGCHGHMVPSRDSDDYACTHCGNRQKVVDVVTARKVAFWQALLPLAMRAIPWITSAFSVGKSAFGGGQEQNTGGIGSDAGSLSVMASADEDNGNFGNDFTDKSDEPKAGSKDFTDEVGDSDDLLKDITTDGAASKSPFFMMFIQHHPKVKHFCDSDESAHGDPDMEKLLEAFMNEFPGLIDPEQVKKKSHKVVAFGEGVAPVSQGTFNEHKVLCSVCHQDLNAIKQAGRCLGPDPSACPQEFGDHGNPVAQKPPGMFSSHVENDGFEVTAARRPKMCPVHENMVEFALTLGDPGAAIQAMSPALFGPSSCKGGWVGTNKNGNEYKCRFKPEMVTQSYWDAKEAEAEQRRLQREQQAPVEVPQEIPVAQEESDLLPDEQEFTLDNSAADEIPDTSAVELPTDYDPVAPYEEPASAPVNNVVPLQAPAAPQPVAPQAPLAVAAKTAADDFLSEAPDATDDSGSDSDSITDTEGNPLKAGNTYKMRNPAIDTKIPDTITVSRVFPDRFEFTVDGGGEGFPAYKATVHNSEVKDYNITLEPAMGDEHPNAHGETNSDNTGYTGPGTDDLSDSKNSKVAGRYFSPTEQRALINEDGVARNLEKMNLEGTHYNQTDLPDPEFLWV